MYGSQILSITIYHLAKLSLVSIFIKLTPSGSLRRALWLFAIFLTALWAAYVISFALQCAPQEVWAISGTDCVNQV